MGHKGRKHWRDRHHGRHGGDRPRLDDKRPAPTDGEDFRDARPRSGYPGQGDQGDFRDARPRSGYPDRTPPAESPRPFAPRDDTSDRGRSMSGSMRRSFLGARAEVSIILLLQNAEAVLEPLLACLNDQRPSRDIELLAVDRDSKDRTPLILRSRGIRSLYVPASRTLSDVAMAAAEGESVVFLGQDTFPLGTGWLAELLRPFSSAESVGISYGRLVADADVPPYPRGLVSARPHISGKNRLLFEAGTRSPGAGFLPHTNVAVSRKLFSKAGTLPAPGPGLVQAAFGAGFAKAFAPEATAILKGEIPASLLESTEIPLPISGVAADAVRLWKTLSELSERGDLPSGDKGDAYLFALGRFLEAAGSKAPAVKRVARLLKLA